MSELQCFVSAISSTVSSDDEVDGDTNPLVLHQPKGWASGLRPSWLGSGLRLRVKGLSGFGGGSFSRWLEGRESSPLSATYFARCAPRLNCVECNSARNLTCDTLDLGNLCRSCADGAPLYCSALGYPTLCPRWDNQKVREFTKRWEFYRRGPVEAASVVESNVVAEVTEAGGSGMATRTVLLPEVEVAAVSSAASKPVGSRTLPAQHASQALGLSLDPKSGGNGRHTLTTSRVRPPVQDGCVTLVEKIAGLERADYKSFNKSCVSTGALGQSALGSNLADRASDLGSSQLSGQGCRGLGLSSLAQPPRQNHSEWERGNCPLGLGHCASTPSQPAQPFGGFSGVNISGVGGRQAVPPPPLSARPAPLLERVAGSFKKEVRFDPKSGVGQLGLGGREMPGVGSHLEQSSLWGGARQLDPSVLMHVVQAEVHADARSAEGSFRSGGHPRDEDGPRDEFSQPLRGLGVRPRRNEQGEQSIPRQQLGIGASHLLPPPAAVARERGDQSSGDDANDDHNRQERRSSRQGSGPSDRESGGGGGNGRRRPDSSGRGRRNPDGGDGDDGDSSDGNGSPPPRRRRQRPRHSPDRLTDALGLIVNRLESLSATGTRSPSAKQRPISVPPIPREPDGTVGALSFWEWLVLISRLVADLHLDESHVLLVLITDSKVLPAQWRQVCMGSDSLAEALKRLCDRNAPRSSTFPLLVARLTGQEPTNGTHDEVIKRAGELLADLSLLRQLHPERDLSREQALATLWTLGSSLELQSGVVDAVDEMTFLQNLPAGDPRRQSFVTSIANYLERQRKIRSDLLASVACGKWGGQTPGPPHATSFAQPLRAGAGGQGGGARPGAGKGAPPRVKGGAIGSGSSRLSERDRVGGDAGRKVGAAGKAGANGKSKHMCGFNCGESHPTWECKKVLDVRLKKAPIPSTVCAKCCSVVKPGLPHQPNCHIHEFKRTSDGKLCRINRLCPIHKSEGRHHLLCSSCGREPQVVKALPVVAVHSAPLAPIQRPLGGGGVVGGEVVKIPRVLFMSEVLTLIDKHDNKLNVVVHYDTMSGVTFCSDVPSQFNHGDEHLSSELFNLSTFVGEGSYSLPVVTLKLLGQVAPLRGPQSVISYVSDYPSIPPVDLPKNLLQLKPGNASPEDLVGCNARLMLGAEYSDYFPLQVKTPACLRREYVGMVAYRSRLSGKLLLAGQLDREHVHHKRPVVAL